MAYDSIPHDGITTGHAVSTDVWSAPYTSTEWADYWKKVFSSNAARGFVIPGYANNLKVSANSPAALNVLLATGAAFVRGRAFENTSQATLAITAADATNPRLDRIILEYDSVAQTITPSVLAGTPANPPSLPALTQTATTYQVSLAYVWVAALASSIADTDIHEERIFEANFESLLTSLGQDNLIYNSEFMAYSALDSSVNEPPDGWDEVGTLSNSSTFARPAQMSRGRSVQLTADAADEGISQTIQVKASTMYSFKTLVSVSPGLTGLFMVTTDSASPNTISRILRRTGSPNWVEETIYYITESDATTLTVSLLCHESGNTTWGQTLAFEGYHPGTFRQFHERILFKYRMDDTSWDGDVKADGTATIDFDSNFSGRILEGTRGVLIHYMAEDSGSASGNASAPLMAIKHVTGSGEGAREYLSQLRFSGITNSTPVSMMAEVLLDSGNRIYVETADVTQLTAYLYIVGIIT